MNSNYFIGIDFIYWLLKSVHIAISQDQEIHILLYNSKHNLQWHCIYTVTADKPGRIEFQIVTIKDIW